jgi:hypothetical protein
MCKYMQKIMSKIMEFIYNGLFLICVKYRVSHKNFCYQKYSLYKRAFIKLVNCQIQCEKILKYKKYKCNIIINK